MHPSCTPTSQVGLASIFGPLCVAATALLQRSPQEFKLAELSIVLWAVATAGFAAAPQAAQLFEAACSLLLHRELDESCDGHATSNLLWALTVADVRQRATLRRLHAHFVSLHQRGRVSREGLAQAHQYQLWAHLELKDATLAFDPSMRKLCREAMEVTHAGINISGFQGHIARVLRELGLTYQLELNLSGYSVDLALPDSRVVVEVDGPHHYLYDYAPGLSIDRRQLIPDAAARVVAVNGSTMLKQRHMRAMGWRPTSIPFYEFELLHSTFNPTAVTVEHKRYVGAKLAAAKLRQ